MAGWQQEALGRIDVTQLAEETLTTSSTSSQPHPPQATKVVATIGGSSSSEEQIAQLISSGASVARVPVSYAGTSVRSLMASLFAACKATRALVASVIDLQGRQLNVGGFNHASQPIELAENDVVVLTAFTEGMHASKDVLPVRYSHLSTAVRENDTIAVNSYLTSGMESTSVFLQVVAISENNVTCTCLNSATLQPPLLTVRLPEMPGDLPVVSQEDAAALQELIDHKLPADFVSTFCHDASDVAYTRTILDKLGLHDTKILAKMGTVSSIYNLPSIVDAADGVIISRGNLLSELAAEKGFLAQAYACELANLAGKPAIVTRVMDSLITNTSPTRAESTDVANAVLGGCDAIILGAETVRGIAPANAVSIVARICAEAEKAQRLGTPFSDTNFEAGRGGATSNSVAAAAAASALSVELNDEPAVTDARAVGARGLAEQSRNDHSASSPTRMEVAQAASAAAGEEAERSIESSAAAAVRVAEKLRAPAIIAFTRSGRSARLLAKYRPALTGGTKWLHSEYVMVFIS